METRSYLELGEKVPLTIGSYYKCSIANRSIETRKAFCEFIDNAIAARSNSVVITINPGQFIRVKDFGMGIENLDAAFAHGMTCMKDDPMAINTFGVGLKDGAAGLGYILEVETVFDGVRSRGICDWSDATFLGYVRLPQLATMNGEVGTTITISKLKSKSISVSNLKTQIEQTYRPLLLSGKEIEINGESLTPVKCGKPIDTTNRSIMVDESRAISCRGGIFESFNDYKRGFIFIYKGRVLFETNEFCGDHSPSQNFYAELELLDRKPNAWKKYLAPDKCGFAEDLDLPIRKAIYDIFSSILAKCQDERKRFLTKLVNCKLDFINQLLGGKKVLKQNGDAGDGATRPGPRGVKPGTKVPTGKGNPHVRTKNPRGDGKYRKFLGQYETGILIQWTAMEPSEPLITDLQIMYSPINNQRNCRIEFNKNHPWAVSPDGREIGDMEEYADDVAVQIVGALAAHQSMLPPGHRDRIINISGEVKNEWDAFLKIHSEFMKEIKEYGSKKRRHH